ncbi:MAG: transposase [Candidatus Acidiferrum sp.]
MSVNRRCFLRVPRRDRHLGDVTPIRVPLRDSQIFYIVVSGLNPYFETDGNGTLCRERNCKVARKRKGRYPNEFRRMAVERLKRCENIVALSEELGVHRRLLYKWRDQLDPVDIGDEPPPENPRESTLRKEVSQLKRLLAEKTLEVDFFKGALQKVEARRQKHGITGEKASTTKSGE